MSAPDEAEVLSAVREFVVREFLYMRPEHVLGDTDALLGTGVIDSMGVLEVLGFLDGRFGVQPTDDEITEENLGSLRAIARFVRSKLG